MNALFKLQFNYCPLVWMYHSCTLNNQKSYLKDVLAEYIVTKLPFFWRFFNKIVPCINSHEDHTHSHKWNV